jgi:hypothetical protein
MSIIPLEFQRRQDERWAARFSQPNLPTTPKHQFEARPRGAARCSPDLIVRRRIDAVVFETRRDIANAAQAMADKCGEPPLSEQG